MGNKTGVSDIKLIIFDMDDVLYRFYPKRRVAYFSQIIGKSAPEIREAWFLSGWEARAEAGAFETGAEYLAAFNRIIGYEFTREEWIEGRRLAMEPDPQAISLLRVLAKQTGVAMLTNNGALLRECLPMLTPDLAEIFGSRLHASYEFGARKPDPLVYSRLIGFHGFEARHSLFVDDRPENVEGARAAGLHAHLFSGIEELRHVLWGLGLSA